MEDAELVHRCRAGDELAWEVLIRRYQGRIYALAYHYVRHAEEARDLTQDIFVRIYRGLPRFQKSESFVPWMLRIARTAAIDHLRRRKARPPADDIPVEDMYGLADDGPGPDDQLEALSCKQLVHRALKSLTEAHREVILLKDIQGLSLEEISGILDVPVGTVKSRSNRARLELAREVLSLQDGMEGEMA